MPNIIMKYGDYSFIPVPFITLSKSDSKTGAGKNVGTVFTLSLSGTLTTLPNPGGLAAIDTLQDTMRAAMDRDGKLFILTCDGTELIKGYPRISQNVQFNTSSDNWIFSCPFTLELEFDEEPYNGGENPSLMPPYILSANESWSVEFEQERNRFELSLDSGSGSITDASPYVLRMTHSVSAVGKMHYEGTGESTGNLDMEAWEQARSYVTSRLGFSDTHLIESGVLNLDASIFGQYNHIRNLNIGEAEGSFSVDESWLVVSSGAGIPGNALEDFTITNRNAVDSALTNVSIEGTITGLETRSYGSSPNDFTITQTKYDSALAYWNVVKNRLYYRAQHVSDTNVNPDTISNVVGHNPVGGVITYSYEFDDRPCNFIAGSKSETIVISDQNPIDIYATIVIPGRSYGPILQGLNTISEFSRSVDIDILVSPPTGCSNIMTAINSSPASGVKELLCDVEQDMYSTYSQVFKSRDEENWDIKTGRYSRGVTWVGVKCSGASPDTSLCS
jgi:hypothetical protein